MIWADWLALAFVVFASLLGFRKGLIGSSLSAAGIVAGAVLGARLAPHLLPSGGDGSPYTPLVGLGGALFGALVLETIGTLAGNALRSSLRLPALHTLDSVGGILVGAAAGLVVVWIAGAIALHFPGQTEARRTAQRSVVLQRLNRLVPPTDLMEAIERVDPFPTIVGPEPPREPPDPALLRRPSVARAAPSVVRVLGTACGLAVTGTGWVARSGLVVTAAHVVAGQRDTIIELGVGSGSRLRARAVAYDPRNDLAILRVAGLRARPLPLADPDPGDPVAILGYPESGPFAATAGRIGTTATVLSEDAYGRGPVRRAVTSLSGRVREGNSGSPAVNADGEVETTVFAARAGSGGGFGIPSGVVRDELAGANGPVSTGPCAR